MTTCHEYIKCTTFLYIIKKCNFIFSNFIMKQNKYNYKFKYTHHVSYLIVFEWIQQIQINLKWSIVLCNKIHCTEK